MALQFPQLQTRIAQKAVAAFEERLSGNMEVDRIAVVFINKVMIYGVSITGGHGDTLASVDKLSLSVSPGDLLRGRIRVNRLFLQDGCFNLIKEGPGKYNNINRIFNTQPKPDSLSGAVVLPDMYVDEIILRNMAFSLIDNRTVRPPREDGCIDFKNLQVRHIDARISRAEIIDNTISCRIRDLSCIDRSGYEVRSLSGTFSLDSCMSRLDNMHLMDSWSEINARYLSFGYSSGKDFQDFVNRVIMGADLNSSVLDFRSIGVFAPELRDNSLRLRLSGEITGPVCSLSSDNLRIIGGSVTDMSLSAYVTGLPDIRETDFNLTLKSIATTSEELSGIISAFSGKENNIGSIIPGTEVTLSGTVQGKISDFQSSGTLTSDIGKVSYDALFHPAENGHNLKAALRTEELDAGVLSGSSVLGKVTLEAGLDAVLPAKTGGSSMSAELENLKIHSMEINGHRYRDINMTATMLDASADIRLLSHDPAFPAMFQSIVSFTEDWKPERIRAFMDVPYADLKAMNLVEKGTVATAGVTAKADLRFSDRSILGSVLLDNISYINDNGQYHTDSIYVRSALSEDRHTITLRSPFMQAGYTSTDSPSRLVERLKLALHSPATDRLLTVDTSVTSGNNGYYDFSLRTFDMSQICEIIKPGLYIADSTSVNMRLDERNRLTFDAGSSSVSFTNPKGGGYSMEGISLRTDNYSGAPCMALSIKNIVLGKIVMDNALVSASCKGDGISLSLGYRNADSTWLTLPSLIRAWKSPSGHLMADISIDSSLLNLRNHKWTLTPTTVSIRPRNYTISGFGLYSAEDSIRISGSISDNPESVLSLSMRNMNLDLINSFTATDMDIQGKLSGDVDLFNFFSGKGASMEIEGSGLSIKGEDIGNLSVLSRRDIARNRFNILINNYIGEQHPVNVSGYFIPGRNYMDLEMLLDRMQLKVLSPFLSDFLSISGGSLSGNIGINGQLDKLMLSSSNSRLDSLTLTPAFTKVPYIINGPISLSSGSISLDSLTLDDPSGSTAVLNGSVTHDFFKNFYLDANMAFQNFKVLNTTEWDNEKFYGSASASGQVTISGYTDNLVVDAQVTTGDNSSLHVPLSSSSSAASTDLISFTDFRQPQDTSAIQNTAESGSVREKARGNIEIRATAGITPGTELLIEMDKQLGEVLRCTGNGNINVTLNPSRNLFDVRGDYTISEGSYHFVLSIQSRDFTLDEGGTIAFNGDFRNTNLNVGATYRTKASISTLIADTTSVGNRRNVNCGIQLQGPLTNPELSFSIDIPDLDPITKGRVESALSTPDKIQKQFMALLISGSFVPDEQSGIVNNSTILYSNASEILSNQFNNIFRQLDIPLDLGLNYQPGMATGGRDMFDVAVSYQAFNNRLIINGNLGNSETSSNWAGDFEAEIKVDRQGKLRITLFTRSADTYSNYLDNTQRSGFGVTYQDEFDTFGDFWRNIFMSRKRKEQYELQLLKEAEDELEKEASEANIRKEEVIRPRENPMNFLEETGSVEYQEEEQTVRAE